MPERSLDAFLRRARDDPAATLIALDIDGTVSRIAPSPGEAVVDQTLRSTLERLGARYALWFLSGRDADAAARLVGVTNAGYVGAHGLELLDRNGLRPLAAAGAREDLARLANAVARTVPEASAHVERKRWGIAFHYRAAPQIAERLRAAVDAHLTPALRVQPGKMVLEVLPALPHDKGTALTRLLDDTGARHVLVAGDDLTDVAAFRALAVRRAAGALDGFTVAVRSDEAPTELLAAADVTVDGVQGLHALLRRWLE
jgi:trehalose 6-phosphate phosphatase